MVATTATEPDTLELVALGRMVAVLREPFVLPGTPGGTRLIFEVTEGHIEGERLRGRMVGNSAADWLTVGPEGTASLDVRALLETHDGALVFVHYTGRIDMSTVGAPVYATPRFDTGDERYLWLNRIQAVGKGAFDGTTLIYDLFELR